MRVGEWTRWGDVGPDRAPELRRQRTVMRAADSSSASRSSVGTNAERCVALAFTRSAYRREPIEARLFRTVRFAP